MGMSTHVVGFRPPDEKWKAMAAVWDSCKAAGIEPPREVSEFFDWREPDSNGVEIKETALTKAGAVREWHDDCRSGYEIDVSKLPPDVTVVRVYNSW
jgi:hypothetical protein